MDTPLPISANANADLLRALDGPDRPATQAELRTRVGRDSANFARTLDRLAEDGLMDRETLDLTENGRRARKALDLAEGRLDVPEHKILVLWSELEPHPDNPRGDCGAEELAALADTLEAEGVLQDLEVTEPKPGGKRLILIGERRWRASRLLVEAGRWPQDTRLPATETVETPGLIYERSVVENGQRVSLTNLEQAYALFALAKTQNLQAPALARRTGLHLRVVQESLKVAREAAPDTLEAHRVWLADNKAQGPLQPMSWERLRDSVKEHRPKPSLDVTPKLALVLVELAAKIYDDPAGPAGCTRIYTPPPGGEWSTLRDRSLVAPEFVGDGSMYARLDASVKQWLNEIGFYTDGIGAALRKAREAVVGPLEASTVFHGQFLTPWLNMPTAAAPAPAPTPEPDAEDERDAAPPPADPADPVDPVALYERELSRTAAPQLKPDEALVITEIAHKVQREPVASGRGFDGAEVGRFAADSMAQFLITNRWIGFVNGPRKHFLVYLTPKAKAWLALDLDGQPLTDEALTARQHELNHDKGPTAYATPWLNLSAEPAEEAATAPTPAPDPTGADAFARQLREVLAEDDEERDEAAAATASAAREEDPEEAEARLILGQVLDTTAPSPQLLRSLFAAAGIELPLKVGESLYAGVAGHDPSILDASNSVRIDCNPDIDIHDALGEARARLIAMAVNAACMVEEG